MRRSIACVSTCAWRTAGAGSTTVSTRTSAPWSRKSADCSAAGSGKALPEKGGRHGSESRWRPVLLYARRDATTCGRDSPAPSIQLRPQPANRGRPAFSAAPAAPDGADPDVERTQHAKAEVVVAVVGIVVVAGGRARVGGLVVPRPTAHHPGHVSGNPTELHSAAEVWRQTPVVAKKAPLRGAAREQQASAAANSAPAPGYSMGNEHNTRKPR